ncbi:class I SAM-dependent methyltransferase [Algoriphagus aestuarii]|nr:class I SAM-dependent methyltransferase [Algoriphagus aestuarii]
MRQIVCPVCHTSSTSQDQEEFSIVHCKECGVKWTYLSSDINSDSLYEDEVYAIVDNRESIFEKIIFREAEKVLTKARRIQHGLTRMLDFGCGKGQFMHVSNRMGFSTLGIETATKRADFAREKYGLEVKNDFYSSGKIESGDFDFVTLNHVLEHLPYPMSLLKELLSQNLSTKGLVYIEVPRADSWQSGIAGREWMHWDIPKHLTHWDEQTLEQEMLKIGYQKVGDRKFSIHLGVLGMLQALLSKVGFRENLILRLKRKKTFGLMALIVVFMPLAWIMEGLSTLSNKSGILGLYFKKK